MKDSYSNLCVFNYGKHSYVVMKSSDKVMYFESVNGKYVMPITNFNLYDNEGKSLTLVNQHFFMSQLVNRINVAFKKGYFSNEKDIIKYLNNLKNNSENDVNLNKLFKGSFMNEIDEKNFESNKREILKYLDSYRFDTFESYNNVSIFDGSLEKGSIEDGENIDNGVGNTDVLFNSNDSEKVDDEVVTFDDIDESGSIVSDQKSEQDASSINNVGEGFNFDTVKSTDSNEFVNSNDYFSSLGNVSSQEQVNTDAISDINLSDNFNKTNQVVDNLSVDNVDLSNSVNGFNNSNLQSNDNLDNTIFIQGGSFVNNEQINNLNQDVVPVSQNSESLNNVLDNNNSFINGVSNVNVSNEQVLNTDVYTNLENPSFVSDSSSSDPFSLSNSLDSNVSYIDQVKDRMNSGYNKSDLNESQNNEQVESFGFSSSGITTGDSVISDNSELPELEQISSEPVSSDVVEKKKSHLGIIIFMILLVLALGALSFYLYNYVF